MKTCGSPTDRYDWLKRKADFAIVLAKLRGEVSDPVVVQKAVFRIEKCCYRTAVSLLRRWRVGDPESEAYEVVQRWYLNLCSTAFEGCDNTRSVPGYAYTILRRCCSAVVRDKVRDRLRSHDWGLEPRYEKSPWLDSISHTEKLSELNKAIDELSPALSDAVKEWLLNSESNLPFVFASVREQSRFHNYMFRARRRLKEMLRDHSDEVAE
jgi:hypothetical protein